VFKKTKFINLRKDAGAISLNLMHCSSKRTGDDILRLLPVGVYCKALQMANFDEFLNHRSRIL